jgi:hypothetical protein
MENKLTVWLAGLGVLATIVYGILRLAYLQFYYPFGIRPEDVGIDRTEILSQAIVGPVVIGFAPAFVTLVGTTAVLLGWRVWRNRKPISREFLLSIRQELVLPSLLVFLLFIILGLTSTYISAVSLSNKVLDHGEAITNDYFTIGPYAVPDLEMQVLPVKAEWKDAGQMPADFSPRANGIDCFVYLGQSNNVAILYNVKTSMTFRVNLSDVTLRLDTYSYRLPDTCRPRAQYIR